MSTLTEAVSDLRRSLEERRLWIDRDDPVVDKIKEIEHHLDNIDKVAEHFEKTPALQLKAWAERLRRCDDGTIASTLDGIQKDIKYSVLQLKHMQMIISNDMRSSPWQDDLGSQSQKEKTASELLREARIFEDEVMDPAMRSFQVSYDLLDQPQLKLCLLFLSIFPENEVIKRRPLIYWWIGEGLIKDEDEGEQTFERLLKHDLIIPNGNGRSPIVKECQIHPWIRYMLISLAKKAYLFDFDGLGTPLSEARNSRRACLVLDAAENLSSVDGSNNLRTIFNVNESQLNFESVWFAQLKKLMVLQLGRWQADPTHHIEAESEAFLNALRTHKRLKYLSLRGVSKITKLPGSILELVSLEILDLKHCHSLESLPSEIGKLRRLTHLDVSKCYLLQSLPNGIKKLTSLQVLKGFILIIGKSNKSTARCRIADLLNLTKLKRLSIYIRGSGSGTVIQDSGEFAKLKSLRCLKISWFTEKPRECAHQQDIIAEQSSTFLFPSSLEKLDLEGLPHKSVPKWLKPSQLQGLKKLYIKGGQLSSLEHGERAHHWNVEILHLNYLKNMEIEWPKLRNLFPLLTYAQVIPYKEAQESSQEDRNKYNEWRYSTKRDQSFPSQSYN